MSRSIRFRDSYASRDLLSGIPYGHRRNTLYPPCAVRGLPVALLTLSLSRSWRWRAAMIARSLASDLDSEQIQNGASKPSQSCARVRRPLAACLPVRTNRKYARDSIARARVGLSRPTFKGGLFWAGRVHGVLMVHHEMAMSDPSSSTGL